MKEKVMAEQTEGAQTLPPQAGGEGLAQPPDEPNVLATTEKGPGFFRKLLGQETEPLILVKPGAQVIRLEQGEPTEPPQPPEQPQTTQTSEATQEITPQQAVGQGGNGGAEGGDGGDGGGGPERENPEEKDPQYRAHQIAEALQLMDRQLEEMGNMSDQERRLFVEKYDEYCRIFTRYYNQYKLFDKNAGTVAMEETIKTTDQNLIDNLNLPEAEQTALKELLRKYDQAQAQLREIDNTLAVNQALNGKSKLFDEKGWQQQETRRNQLQARVQALEGEIDNPALLQARREERTRIASEVGELQGKIEEREQAQLRGQRGEPGDWERKLVIEDRKIELRELAEELLPFHEVLEFLNSQEQLRKTGDPNFWLEGYNRAKETLSWYFQEAERERILYDLGKSLGFELEAYMQALGLHPNQRGELSQTRTIDEVLDLIEEKSGARPDLEESDRRWQRSRRVAGLSGEQETRFKGVKGEYVRRAYEQMWVSLTNLVHLKDRLELQGRLIRDEITYQKYTEELGKIPRDIATESVFGEWNFGFEARARRELEDRILREQRRPFFDETEFGLIVLTGETSWEIEQGAVQAAEFIERSAGTYSLEAIQARREYLIRAIEKQTTIIGTEAVNRIKRVALNKLDFYILQWLTQNLRMDEFSRYFEQTVMIDGLDRLKAIPSMNNGLTGLAIRFLLQPEYRLFFRPAGFRNQLNESGAQDRLRNLLKEQIVDRLLNFEIKGENWQEKIATLQKILKVQSTNQFIKLFTQWDESDSTHHPQARLTAAQKRYEDALKAAQQSSADPEALLRLREAREMLAFEHQRHQRAKQTAQSALDEAIRALDIFGETARYGTPSIVMKNGDRISVEHVKLIKKFAILQAAKKYGDTNRITVEEDGKQVTYRVEDHMGSIRRRSQEWIRRWSGNGHFWENGMLSEKKMAPFRNFSVTLKNRQEITFRLAPGFEETGLTTEEWQQMQEFDQILRSEGFNARFKIIKRDEYGEPIKGNGQIQMEEVSFWDIIQMDELQPVLSNFIADYKSSTDQINDEELIEQAATGAVGRLETIQAIRRRLGIADGVKIEGETSQDILKKYTAMITDSAYFDEEIENLVYFEAVHVPGYQRDGQGVIGYQTDQQKVLYLGKDGQYHEQVINVYPTSVKRVDYGHQGLPWGKKRQQNPKPWWYTNEDRTISRAEDTIWFMPVYSYSLSQESASKNILEMFWDLNRLEKDDNWVLMTYGMRVKDAWDFRIRAEGDIVNEGGVWKKIWGMLEKPGSNANFAWTFFPMDRPGRTPEEIRKNFKNMTPAEREKVIEWLYAQFFGDRFAPMTVLQEKQNALDRQALSSGLGYENNQKFAYRFVTRWLYSAKEGDGRTEGGIPAYREIEAILYWMMDPGSYREELSRTIDGKKEVLVEEASVFDETWRKQIPSHNPRIRYGLQEPTYVRLKKVA